MSTILGNPAHMSAIARIESTPESVHAEIASEPQASDWNPGEQPRPGAVMRAWRTRLGFTRAQLAKIADVHPGTIARWETSGETSDHAHDRSRWCRRAMWLTRQCE